METSIRVCLKTLSVDAVLACFDFTKGSYMYAVEGLTTSNPHVHMYLCNDTALATIRARLRKLGLSGNGGYSISTVRDKFKCLAYFMKGGEYETNLPEEVIQQARVYDEQVKTSMAEKRAKPKSALHEMSKLFNEAHQYAPLWDHGNNHRRLIQQAHVDIARFILHYHREHDLPIRKHQLQMQHDTIMFWHPDLTTYAEREMIVAMTGITDGEL